VRDARLLIGGAPEAQALQMATSST